MENFSEAIKFTETDAEGKKIQYAVQYNKRANQKSFETGGTLVVFKLNFYI